uniref:Uncharacterized protein n=1 Tax=Lepeophtheirus salmonis TaxID=72036 RepID=A0A0K2V226_LEPSM
MEAEIFFPSLSWTKLTPPFHSKNAFVLPNVYQYNQFLIISLPR